ncbi:MAG: Ribosomal RNA small subunit methyltransferase H [Candidatus Nomurabacteria bacterium GW2011_GWE1_32_28]|uniref:Ribosomal RNA small subunit methyltransferase H n=1 Tax=Candidatus Nomurabacteria bacterium GW2011_GWF1_31_48 TaxID=1618767 RepID=A0A0F9YGH4_9BACT|nr:MAG: Ribosomal RNA small subunit methyltransferase H [Candidatus Nomurabacteria bacterium GW2011_GWF2_30_133]KKP29062.1 MAG: Ribosomal RNA small subunit methyltransferase H [Candidatus Nomurabacteria bacterium GW2011_GWE2_31_40]KKP30528.1 MAG: Ribosomal RNA small subunit methyltransferase H [Candidatus Nomurabacteria bacterium GW2011_GWF1_31_48]KKP35013.1 MAG: Ribosomal RNA small subunit methyltransferase H [Candidatus Nomurabacteria bacterium GW2011_GWE1_32_28]HAS80619.1 16S rRNA (cytosine(
MRSVHKTVLLNETIDGLNLSSLDKKDNVLILDATFGGGGHSIEILKRYPNVKIIALDQDKGAWEKAKDKFKGLEKRISFINKNFRDIDQIFQKENLKDSYAFTQGGIRTGNQHDALNLSNYLFDGIIFDLGLSSDQLENSGRGFSFMKNEPLLMTMKENPLPEDLTAMDIINGWSEKSLADIIYGYGEERFSRRIAKAIIEARKLNSIENTEDLVKVISDSVPASYRRQRLHFATRTFQALRIAVNDELGVLEKGLEAGLRVLKKGGRISVISFHSLEDRIVKRFFKDKKDKEEVILINKKPIIANEEEIINNPRSRSSKLRILEKII